MDVFSLMASLGLNKDSYDSGLSSAETTATQVGNKIGSAMTTIASATVAGITAAATAVGALVKQSVEAYGDYEQLVGGVETLFGTGGQDLVEYAKSVGKTTGEVKDEYFSLLSAQETVMENAANAYQTAGLSANDYMEQVTSFAAALTSSLDGNTAAAAKKADVAITDMADNANKMGTSMEAIQNAYNGFAKQNYTMLDNLKLGYGGTKDEMERLLSDAEKISGIKYDVSSYADIVDAIHVVQEEMGITGTTSKEAASTIQGSLSMMKAAWENLITGIANEDADFDSLINNMITSVEAVANNILPRVQVALEGVGTLVTEMVPAILEKALPMINEFLPQLATVGSNMISSLLTGVSANFRDITKTVLSVLGTIADCITTNLPALIAAGQQMTISLLQGLTENSGSAFSAISEMLTQISDTIMENLPVILECGLQLIQTLAQGIADALPELIPAGINIILELVDMLTNPDNLTSLVDSAVNIILALVNGLIAALPQLIQAIPTIIENLVQAIVDNLPTILEAGVQIIGVLVQAIIENLPLIVAAAVEIIFSLIEGLVETIPDLLLAFADLMTEIQASILESLPGFIDGGIQVVGAIIQGLLSMVGTLIETGLKLAANIVKGISNHFSRLYQAGQEVVTKVKEGFSQRVADAKQWGQDMIQNFIDGILAKWNALKDTVRSVADSVASFLHFSEPDEGPLSNFHTYAPDMMELFAKGVRDNTHVVTDQIAKSFDFGELGNFTVAGVNIGGVTGMESAGVTYNQTINVNQEVSTADELARAVRIESRYGLMRGVALG